ncbi:MAG: hypothetical protein P1U34_10360 [Coxiellaceae bacterium]|nr:hypothetical protein [Coxiellaceae bacterium]
MISIVVEEITVNVDEAFGEFLNVDDVRAFELEKLRPILDNTYRYKVNGSIRESGGHLTSRLPSDLSVLSVCILLNKVKHAKFLYESFDLDLGFKQYQAFRIAARHGRLHAIKMMVLWSSREKYKMLEANKYEGFAVAAQNSHFDVLKELRSWQRTSSKRNTLIMANDFAAFARAAEMGKLDVLLQLVEWLPNKHLQKMLAGNHFSAFYWSAVNGHVEVVEQLMEWATEEALAAMIDGLYCEGLRIAAENGHIAVIKAVYTKIPEALFDTVIDAFIKYDAIQEIVKQGEFDILKQVYEWSTADQRDRILEKAKGPSYHRNSEVYTSTLKKFEALHDFYNKEKFLYALDQRLFGIPESSDGEGVKESASCQTSEECLTLS